MYKLALLGRDIGYSRSPEVNRAIATALGRDTEFDVLDVKYDELEFSVRKLTDGYDGFFVTTPYKTAVNKFLTGGTDAINVVRSRDRAVFDTDGIGFLLSLDRNFVGWREKVKSVLVLGAGGAARAVTAALVNIGKTVYVLDRTVMNAVRLTAACGAELYTNQPTELAVNCTSVGRNGEDVLKALCVIPEFDYAFDLIYADNGTRFLSRAASFGAAVADGKDMLVYQALEGVKLITGETFDTHEIFVGVAGILNK